jgi:hypothetical protein
MRFSQEYNREEIQFEEVTKRRTPAGATYGTV